MPCDSQVSQLEQLLALMVICEPLLMGVVAYRVIHWVAVWAPCL